MAGQSKDEIVKSLASIDKSLKAITKALEDVKIRMLPQVVTYATKEEADEFIKKATDTWNTK